VSGSDDNDDVNFDIDDYLLDSASYVPRQPTLRQQRQQRRYSVLRRQSNTKLASLEQQQQLRMSVENKNITVADLDMIMSMMLPHARARLQQLLDWTFKPSTHLLAPCEFVGISPDMSPTSTDVLVRVRCAELVHDYMLAEFPTAASGRAFCVVETKQLPDGTLQQRLRPILHTATLNAYLREIYSTDLDLFHISRYLNVFEHSHAVVGDIQAGFFSIEIPLASRRFFRFRDASGQLC
jgi:hypothetical protein